MVRQLICTLLTMVCGVVIAGAMSGCAAPNGPGQRYAQAPGYAEPEPGDTRPSDAVRPQVPKMY